MNDDDKKPAVSPAYEGHYDGLQDGSYIKAAEFKLGTEFTVTLEKVHKEQLEGDDGKKKGKGVVAFRGKEKEWVTNKTNLICLAAMFGPMVKDWAGKRITIVTEMVSVGAEKRPGFRIKGSPDITAPIDAVIKLPRKRPITRTLVPTGTTGQRQGGAQ
jgi:hypothetical protein